MRQGGGAAGKEAIRGCGKVKAKEAAEETKRKMPMLRDIILSEKIRQGHDLPLL